MIGMRRESWASPTMPQNTFARARGVSAFLVEWLSSVGIGYLVLAPRTILSAGGSSMPFSYAATPAATAILARQSGHMMASPGLYRRNAFRNRMRTLGIASPGKGGGLPPGSYAPGHQLINSSFL